MGEGSATCSAGWCPVTLAELLAAATPGPWRDPQWGGLVVDENENPVVHHALPRDARLIALAPDLARLALDMGEALRKRSLIDYEHGLWRTAAIPERQARDLLARLDGIANKDKTT